MTHSTTVLVGTNFDQRIDTGRIVLFADGSFFKGNFAQGKLDGQGIMIWSDGGCCIGDWKMDCVDGHGVEVLSSNPRVRFDGP